MSDCLIVHDTERKPLYQIVIEESFSQLKPRLLELGTSSIKLCIVTDSNVAGLYGEEIREILTGCSARTEMFVFPAGEENKNLNTVRELYEFLIRHHFDRTDMLVALGGGVTGDLCGFAAATYLRGISFVQIPTTLLSQVDSSIGGKTGVDFDAYKNMVGAFHMPRLVYTNLATLQTLDQDQFSSGMGEIIKHGLIKNQEYYRWLCRNASAIEARDLKVCREMIWESNRIKRDVVENDPKELGERALLNFGHTLGHAIEKLKDFTMLHGHCVGLGCLGAMRICVMRGYVEEECLLGLRRLMESLHMPTKAGRVQADRVLADTKSDKKMDGDTIRFILLRAVGEAFVDRTVTSEEMRAGLLEILSVNEQEKN